MLILVTILQFFSEESSTSCPLPSPHASGQGDATPAPGLDTWLEPDHSGHCIPLASDGCKDGSITQSQPIGCNDGFAGKTERSLTSFCWTWNLKKVPHSSWQSSCPREGGQRSQYREKQSMMMERRHSNDVIGCLNSPVLKLWLKDIFIYITFTIRRTWTEMHVLRYRY